MLESKPKYFEGIISPHIEKTLRKAIMKRSQPFVNISSVL